MMTQRILIAGIGNIFLGDDGFGVEVTQQLLRRTWGAGVRVEDFGIRGFDLAYAIMDGYDATILIDATPRGGAPGTLYVIEIGPEDWQSLGFFAIETHAMDPMKVLQLVRALGGEPKRILVVGCEPQTLGPHGGQMGLSDAVQAAVDEAANMVQALVAALSASLAGIPGEAKSHA